MLKKIPLSKKIIRNCNDNKSLEDEMIIILKQNLKKQFKNLDHLDKIVNNCVINQRHSFSASSHVI